MSTTSPKPSNADLYTSRAEQNKHSSSSLANQVSLCSRAQVHKSLHRRYAQQGTK